MCTVWEWMETGNSFQWMPSLPTSHTRLSCPEFVRIRRTACRASLLDTVAAHVVAVNGVEDVSGPVAAAALLHDSYGRAYAIHVAISALGGWQRVDCKGRRIDVEDEESVEAAVQSLLRKGVSRG